MQVSWIDPDHLNALLAQITPGPSNAEAFADVVELETAPDPDGDFFMEGHIHEVVGTPADVPSESAPEFGRLPTDLPEMEAQPAEPLDDGEPCEEAAEAPALHNPAAALPLSRIRDRLRAIRQRATDAGILARPMSGFPAAGPASEESSSALQAHADEVTATAVTPPFDIPSGPLSERLSAFAAWTRQVLHEDGGHVLVINDEGEVLWGGETRASLVLSAMMAWGAAVRSSAQSVYGAPEVIRKTLASGHVLTVIPCQTSEGVFHAAVAAPAGVPDEASCMIRTALVAAMEAGTGPGGL